jgi:hypothetical protein
LRFERRATCHTSAWSLRQLASEVVGSDARAKRAARAAAWPSRRGRAWPPPLDRGRSQEPGGGGGGRGQGDAQRTHTAEGVRERGGGGGNRRRGMPSAQGASGEPVVCSPWTYQPPSTKHQGARRAGSQGGGQGRGRCFVFYCLCDVRACACSSTAAPGNCTSRLATSN